MTHVRLINQQFRKRKKHSTFLQHFSYPPDSSSIRFLTFLKLNIFWQFFSELGGGKQKTDVLLMIYRQTFTADVFGYSSVLLWLERSKRDFFRLLKFKKYLKNGNKSTHNNFIGKTSVKTSRPILVLIPNDSYLSFNLCSKTM
jgi:hypothetical protein